MSILLFVMFCCAVAGKIDISRDSFLYVWALFSIADALWARIIFRRD